MFAIKKECFYWPDYQLQNFLFSFFFFYFNWMVGNYKSKKSNSNPAN